MRRAHVYRNLSRRTEIALGLEAGDVMVLGFLALVLMVIRTDIVFSLAAMFVCYVGVRGWKRGKESGHIETVLRYALRPGRGVWVVGIDSRGRARPFEFKGGMQDGEREQAEICHSRAD